MKKSVVIALHCFYWLRPVLSLYTIFISSIAYFDPESDNAARQLHYITSSIVTIVLSLILFYLFYLYFFPRFMAKKRVVLFVLYGFMACLAFNLLKDGCIKIAFQTPYFKKFILPDGFVNFLSILDVVSVVGTAATACFFRAFINWYSDIKVKEQLVAKNLQSELALLRAQINPHFLFNTINNIDVLITKDAEAASQYLQKLSDIMRFMLYETSTERIPLTKEIAYIEKYIALQKIRTANENYVQFTISGANDNISIAPMIFIPFIENAFKHSINKKIDHAIDISIAINHQNVTFICKNAYEQSTVTLQENSGLGIELIKQRLQLLYPNMHELNIQKLEQQFIVSLNITTA
jgi:two-component system LytT family sensor kinase